MREKESGDKVGETILIKVNGSEELFMFKEILVILMKRDSKIRRLGEERKIKKKK